MAKFMIVDGIDGAGKTTLINKLAEIDNRVKVFPFPSKERPIGRFIRSIIAGDVEVDPSAMAGLYVADMHDVWAKDIEPLLDTEHVIVCDRFYTSTWAFQFMHHPPNELLASMSLGRYPYPDITVIVDVPVEVSVERTKARGGGKDIFEQADLAEIDRRRNRYLAWAMTYPQCLILDGQRPPDANIEIIQRILNNTEMLRSSMQQMGMTGVRN